MCGTSKQLDGSQGHGQSALTTNGRDEVRQGECASQMEEDPGRNLDKHRLTVKRGADED